MNDSCLQPWIICENDGNVISGHCTCMTGVAEVCSHVEALLFYIEAAVKMCNSQSVTEKKANWLPASVQKIQYKTVQDIDFTSAKTKKKKSDNGPVTTPAEIKVKKLPNVSEPSADELSELFESLHNSGEKSVILSLVPGYACHFRPKALNKKNPQV
ncbi:hypothetical protein SNE40_020415 [Patella caerulea]|uniref:SWIM-type domain-containing protein n=1 Tax=Patella caerulea TaxID=87958 RepID=A0AAN8G4A7_PATCE